ncbi:MAG: DUF1266 domain-containing protein, partial [Deltaproteobacteria bacterium]|nr:DUF1266 domain-containing protein [Deltaproteobacteria bacterium]
MLQDLKAFGSKADKLKWRASTAFEDDRRAFVLRPSALSYRFPDPIIPPDLGHERFFGCPNETNKFAPGNYLKKRYGVTDVATLFKAPKLYHGSHDKFDWFRAHRAGRMSFDLTGFNDDEALRFENMMAVAERLSKVCGNRGFLAWDVGDGIALCRRALAAGLISLNCFWLARDSMAARVAAYYDDWGEYGLSYVCGDIFQIFTCMNKRDMTEAMVTPFIREKLNRMRALTAPGGLWRALGWPKHYPYGKKLAIAEKDIIPMIPDYVNPKICRATDRIVVDGSKVG